VSGLNSYFISDNVHRLHHAMAQRTPAEVYDLALQYRSIATTARYLEHIATDAVV